METAAQPQPTGTPGEIYERDMVPAMFAGWVDVLLDLVEPKPGERLLDVACGTGVVARQALARVGPSGRVVGLDMNPNMLMVARTRAPGVEWHEGNGMDLPFADCEFDVVVCQQGLQFFPDPTVGLSQMRRVLVSGGRVGLAVWAPIETSPGHHALVKALERHVNDEAARVMSSPFDLGEVDALRSRAEAAGFNDVEARTERRECRFPTTEAFTRGVLGGGTLARLGIQVIGEALAAVIDNVDEALQPYVGAEGLVYPMEARLVVGRA
jgi:ubiquinone/menaquinone biosynthesis C-methylase UbiE